MSEETATYTATTIPPGWRDVPPARNGARGMVPITWLGRSVRLSYADAGGKGVETSGTLLDFCGAGPIFNLAGARVLLAWERLVTLEIVEDG